MKYTKAITSGKWAGLLLFGAVLAALFFTHSYADILPKPPVSVHQWRQCDGAAITMRYVRDGMHFFAPAAYNLHSTDGKTVAEFPAIYYLDAALIKVFDHPDLVMRTVNLLIFYLGLFFLFRIGLLFTRNNLLALVPVIFLHTLPVGAFYAATTMPDVPAVSLCIISVYLLLRYRNSAQMKHLAGSIAIASLTVILKPTALLAYLALFPVFLLEGRSHSIPAAKKLLRWGLLVLPLAVLGIWVFWAKHYNAANESQTFLMGTKPIWHLSAEWVSNTFYRMINGWFADYFYPPAFYASFIGIIAFLFWPEKELHAAKLFLLALLIGTVGYLLLFYEQFYHHDYYFIEIYPLLLAGFMAGLYLLHKKVTDLRLRTGAWAAMAVLLALSALHSHKEMTSRYTHDVQFNKHNDHYITLEPLLEANGIGPDEKVISWSDDSPNISLYLMNRTGWTRFPYGLDQARMEACIQQGARYLIIRQEHEHILETMAPYLKELLIQHQTIQVWRLQMH